MTINQILEYVKSFEFTKPDLATITFRQVIGLAISIIVGGYLAFHTIALIYGTGFAYITIPLTFVDYYSGELSNFSYIIKEQKKEFYYEVIKSYFVVSVDFSCNICWPSKGIIH